MVSHFVLLPFFCHTWLKFFLGEGGLAEEIVESQMTESKICSIACINHNFCFMCIMYYLYFIVSDFLFKSKVPTFLEGVTISSATPNFNPIYRFLISKPSSYPTHISFSNGPLIYPIVSNPCGLISTQIIPSSPLLLAWAAHVSLWAKIFKIGTRPSRFLCD